MEGTAITMSSALESFFYCHWYSDDYRNREYCAYVHVLRADCVCRYFCG